MSDIERVAKAIRKKCQALSYLVSLPENDVLWQQLAIAAIAEATSWVVRLPEPPSE